MRRIERRLFLMAAACWPLAGQTPKRQGSWSATGAGRGLLRGTWTAAAGESPHVLVGSWTLRDGNNRVLAGGTWSATKSEEGWGGRWRAFVAKGPGSGGKDAGQLSGTWQADPPLAAGAGLTTMVELAMKNVVSGEWFSGKRTGAWSIRVEGGQQ